MTAFTYLSVIMVMEKLNLPYTLTDEQWIGEYNFANTNIWDSARLLSHNMYRLYHLNEQLTRCSNTCTITFVEVDREYISYS